MVSQIAPKPPQTQNTPRSFPVVLGIAGFCGFGAIAAISLMTSSVLGLLGPISLPLLAAGSILLVVSASSYYSLVHLVKAPRAILGGLLGIGLALPLLIFLVEPLLVQVLVLTPTTEHLLLYGSLPRAELLVTLVTVLGILTPRLTLRHYGRVLLGGVVSLGLVLAIELLGIGRRGFTTINSPDTVLAFVYGPLTWIVATAIAGRSTRTAILA